nr:MAG TPA: Hemimethylated DNA-binding protein YccV like protein [Caudoviricetes sp.]
MIKIKVLLAWLSHISYGYRGVIYINKILVL